MNHKIKYFNENYPQIAFGGASISGEGGGYGFGEITEDDANSLLKYAHDRGIRIYDTAPIYGFGLSEKRMGKAFKDIRDDVFIISKSGVTWHSNKRVDMSNDPIITKKMLEQSLRDLNSDYIDLYMIHWPDKNVDIRKPLEILAKAKLEGKIKHIGLCNTTPEDFSKASEVDNIDCLQSQLNFFERDEITNSIQLAQENDIPFISWGTLDKGILTGRVKKDRQFDKSDCRSWAPWWKKSNKNEKIDKFKQIETHLNNHGHTGLELALHFNLSIKGVSSLLCGMKTHKQIDQTLEALNNPLNEELLNKLEEI